MSFKIATLGNMFVDAKKDLWALSQVVHMARLGFRYKGILDLLPKKDILEYLQDKTVFKDWLDCNNYDVTKDIIITEQHKVNRSCATCKDQYSVPNIPPCDWCHDCSEWASKSR